MHCIKAAKNGKKESAMKNIEEYIQAALILQDIQTSPFQMKSASQNSDILATDADSELKSIFSDHTLLFGLKNKPLAPRKMLVHFPLDTIEIKEKRKIKQTQRVEKQTMGSTNYAFKNNADVLCWHDNQLVNVSISKRKNNQNAYFVHYDGPNKAWNEWVTESKILPKTQSNMKLMERTQKRSKKEMKSVHPLDNIHNLNMNPKYMLSRSLSVSATDDSEESFNMMTMKKGSSKSKEIAKKKRNNNNFNESDFLQQQIEKLQNDLKFEKEKCNVIQQKLSRKSKIYKRLYSECVHGEGPRWNLIEFREKYKQYIRNLLPCIPVAPKQSGFWYSMIELRCPHIK